MGDVGSAEGLRLFPAEEWENRRGAARVGKWVNGETRSESGKCQAWGGWEQRLEREGDDRKARDTPSRAAAWKEETTASRLGDAKKQRRGSFDDLARGRTMSRRSDGLEGETGTEH